MVCLLHRATIKILCSADCYKQSLLKYSIFNKACPQARPTHYNHNLLTKLQYTGTELKHELKHGANRAKMLN